MKRSGDYNGIRWSWFDRNRGKRREFILKYSLAPGTWRQLSAPPTVTSVEKFRTWMLEKLRDLHESGETTIRSRSNATVAELSRLWVAMRENDKSLAASTIKDNTSAMDVHILPKWGKTPVTSLDTTELRAWIRGLERSPSRVRNIVSTFRLFLRDVKREKWAPLRTNPLAGDEVSDVLPELPTERLPVFISAETVQALVDNSAELRHRCRYLVAASTGGSDGELAGLRITDVVLTESVPHIRITQAVQLVSKERGRRRGDTKTKNRVRKVPLHPAAVAAIRDWLANGWELWVGIPPRPEAPLFPASTGKFSRPPMAEQLRKDLEKTGQPTTDPEGKLWEFRALRRTFSSLLAERGVPRDIREALMGHGASSVNSEHYTGLGLATLYEAVQKLPFTWSPIRGKDAPEPTSGGVLGATHGGIIDNQASAPVAQRIEQRFPNSSSGTAPGGSLGNSSTSVVDSAALDCGNSAIRDIVTKPEVRAFRAAAWMWFRSVNDLTEDRHAG